MTYKEVDNLISELAAALKCEYSYYTGESEDVIKTPYLLWDMPGRDDLKADDRNYQKVERLNIEYDSRKRDIKAETVIENMLDENDLSYSKEEDFIEGHRVYEVMYSMEVTING